MVDEDTHMLQQADADRQLQETAKCEVSLMKSGSLPDDAADAAVDGDAGSDDDDADDDELVLCQRITSEEQTEDDQNVDELKPELEPAVVGTQDSEAYVDTESQNIDTENADQETVDEAYQMHQHQSDEISNSRPRQTTEQEYRTPAERPQMMCVNEKHERLDASAVDVYGQCEALESALKCTTSDEQLPSVDHMVYQNSDKECQTVIDGVTELDRRVQSTQDVQCQTTHEISQLNDRLVQTDDDGVMAQCDTDRASDTQQPSLATAFACTQNTQHVEVYTVLRCYGFAFSQRNEKEKFVHALRNNTP